MFLWKCTTPEFPLPLYEVYTNYLQGFSSYAADRHNRRTDRRTDRRRDGQGGDNMLALPGA